MGKRYSLLLSTSYFWFLSTQRLRISITPRVAVLHAVRSLVSYDHILFPWPLYYFHRALEFVRNASFGQQRSTICNFLGPQKMSSACYKISRRESSCAASTTWQAHEQPVLRMHPAERNATPYESRRPMDVVSDGVKMGLDRNWILRSLVPNTDRPKAHFTLIVAVLKKVTVGLSYTLPDYGPR